MKDSFPWLKTKALGISFILFVCLSFKATLKAKEITRNKSLDLRLCFGGLARPPTVTLLCWLAAKVLCLELPFSFAGPLLLHRR